MKKGSDELVGKSTMEFKRLEFEGIKNSKSGIHLSISDFEIIHPNMVRTTLQIYVK